MAVPRACRNFLAAGALVGWIVACGPAPAVPTAAPVGTAAPTPSPAAETFPVAPGPVTVQPVVAPTQSPVPASPVARSAPRLDPLQTIGPVTNVMRGLAVGHQGNVFVAEDIKVRVFDAQGNLLATWGGEFGSGEGQFNYITSLAVDDQDNVYVTDFNNVRIQKFDRSGKFLAQWPTEQPAGPVGVALDSSGNVYVVNHRRHPEYVQKFDTAGHLLLAWSGNGTGPGEFQAGAASGPEELTTDTAGHVYVGDPGNARIQVFADDGKFLRAFGSEGFGEGKFSNGPWGVAVDSSGNTYATDGDSIQEFDVSGQFVAKWDRPGADKLIVLDRQGNIYITDEKTHSVLKYRKP